MFRNPQNMTPEEFELEVKKWFEAAAGSLTSFETAHRENVNGLEGNYEVDVTIRFTAIGGAKFLVAVECKRQKNAVKREVVQILHSRVMSLGAQKGILFATAPFQKGAREFAKSHGIDLVQVCNGSVAYIQMNLGLPIIPANPPPYVGLHECTMAGGGRAFRIMNEVNTVLLRDLLGLNSNANRCALETTVDLIPHHGNTGTGVTSEGKRGS